MSRRIWGPARGIVSITVAISLLGCGSEESVTASASPAVEQSVKQDAAPAPAAEPSKPPFEGTFHTLFEGSQSVLKLQQSGSKVTGNIDQAVLSGTADGNTAKGDVKNPETNQIGGTFLMTRKADQVEFKLTLRDPDSGQTLELPAFAYQAGEPPEVKVELDRQLVGRWRNTYTYTSGDFTAAVDTWLILNPDGTYEYGHSKGGAGGAAGSVVSGRGDATTGKWRVENRNLMYQESGSPGWQKFARYALDGDTMMFTHDDGSKKLWYRQ